ncbi:MAG TPA: type II secretion system protein [Candidatus Saccharimonadales bacterium]|nr:type II secretion system protein [Candidatus Saccharimonadales bacterium]
MTTNALRKQKGFTIIEVVLVLAIAGLIFLIVFLALPQLQKSRRDTQRRNDAGRMLAGFESYASSNNGSYPADGASAGTALTTYAGTMTDPSTGAAYNFSNTVPNPPTAQGDVYYATGTICNGSATTTTGATSRNIAIVMKLENGLYCRSNQ